MKRSINIVGLVAVVATISLMTAAYGKNKIEPLPQALSYQALGNPGPPPSFDPGAYTEYRMNVPGSATVAGILELRLDDGEKLWCIHPDKMSLYPDTPYTEWMIAHWAVSVDGRPWHGTGSEFPGDDLTFERVPWWLLPAAFTPKPNSEADPQHVVRDGDCENGRYVFKNVPPGKFLLETTIERHAGNYSSTTTGGSMSVQNGVEGPELVEGGDTRTVGGAALSDGFVAIWRAPLTVTAKHNYYWLDGSNIKVIAHRIAI